MCMMALTTVSVGFRGLLAACKGRASVPQRVLVAVIKTPRKATYVSATVGWPEGGKEAERVALKRIMLGM